MAASIWLIAACTLLVDGALKEAPEAQNDVLSDAVGDQWLARIRQVVPEKSWSVKRDGDVFEIARTEKIEFVNYVNGPAAPKNESTEERRARLQDSIYKADFRIRMRFAPRMTMTEYEKLAAINDESAQQVKKLRNGLSDIRQKFDSYSSINQDEVRRLDAFNTAVAKLPYHELPELYCDEFSIHFAPGYLVSGVVPFDKTIREECDSIIRSLLRLFGTYDTRVARGERRPQWNDSSFALDRARGLIRIPERPAK
jgi:hypothetical protein